MDCMRHVAGSRRKPQRKQTRTRASALWIAAISLFVNVIAIAVGYLTTTAATRESVNGLRQQLSQEKVSARRDLRDRAYSAFLAEVLSYNRIFYDMYGSCFSSESYSQARCDPARLTHQG